MACFVWICFLNLDYYHPRCSVIISQTFEAGIASAISSFKWRKTILLTYNVHLSSRNKGLAEHVPSKRKTFVYQLYNVGTTSSTLVQHCTNVIQIFCVYWVSRATVDLLIFACLNFREFLILWLFKKFRISEFSFFLSTCSAIIIIFLRDSWIREFFRLAKFAKIKTSRILPDLVFD